MRLPLQFRTNARRIKDGRSNLFRLHRLYRNAKEAELDLFQIELSDSRKAQPKHRQVFVQTVRLQRGRGLTYIKDGAIIEADGGICTVDLNLSRFLRRIKLQSHPHPRLKEKHQKRDEEKGCKQLLRMKAM